MHRPSHLRQTRSRSVEVPAPWRESAESIVRPADVRRNSSRGHPKHVHRNILQGWYRGHAQRSQVEQTGSESRRGLSGVPECPGQTEGPPAFEADALYEGVQLGTLGLQDAGLQSVSPTYFPVHVPASPAEAKTAMPPSRCPARREAVRDMVAGKPKYPRLGRRTSQAGL
nr:hypothetical protein CFP56_24543 [Quercus suber]